MLTVGIIYIPLCFYFIPASGCMFAFQGIFTFHYASTLSSRHHVCLPGEFTFHYASTLSSRRYFSSAYLALFTFHYASTLSGIIAIHRFPFSDLHSTMLLLYRSMIGLSFCLMKIYIPLCFYFIGKKTKATLSE